MKKIFLIISLLMSVNIFADLVEDGKEAYKNENYEKAIKLFTKACDNNNYEGCRMLGKTYKDKVDNLKKGIVFYKKACDGGYYKGCYKLGSYYQHIKHNNDKAVQLYMKTCQLGHATTCLLLSNYYKLGKYVKKNIKKEKYFYNKSKEIDNQTCQNGTFEDCLKVNALGLSLSYSRDVNYYKKNIDFFKDKCKLGRNKPCIELGILEYSASKINKSIKAFEKACKGGDEIGCSLYKKLTKK